MPPLPNSVIDSNGLRDVACPPVNTQVRCDIDVMLMIVILMVVVLAPRFDVIISTIVMMIVIRVMTIKMMINEVMSLYFDV